MKTAFIIVGTAIVLTFFSGCSGFDTLCSSSNRCTHPRFVEAEFTISVDSINVFDADSLKASNIRRGIAPDQPPVFLLWTADIMDHPAQRVKESDFPFMPPTEIVTEHENGNRICFWDLSTRLREKAPFVMRRKFSFVSYDYVKRIDTVPDGASEPIPENIFYRYTQAEPSLEQTPSMFLLADSIVRGEQSAAGRTHRIFDFVRTKMRYKYPPDARGVLEAIRSYEGDCGQYSALFIGLCRCAGIPARQQSGFAVDSGGFGYHLWSEVYLPAAGWVPMDATIPDGFAHLPNNRLIASVGMNLPLKHVPSWATYLTDDVQGNRTDFMQFVTMVTNGFTAKITTERKLLRIE